MIIDEHSLKLTQRKAIGGLISTPVQGTFIHFNTIEEYNGLDLNRIVTEEWEKAIVKGDTNRFVVVAFGDLKNYLYHHR